MHLLGLERQVYLTGAPQFAEALENTPNNFLYAAIWIEAKTDLSVPDIANWHRNPEFTSTSLRSRCIQHPRSQNAEFELANAALHSQQKAIIGSPRVVDAIKINDEGIDETAQLKQMMPVPAIASQARGVKTENGTDLACTEPSNKLVETRTRYGPARRTAKIVVDYLDIVEPPLARFINEVVLATLTLEMDLHLRLSGLTHIYNRLAA
jgi:hypothetical protein